MMMMVVEGLRSKTIFCNKTRALWKQFAEKHLIRPGWTKKNHSKSTYNTWLAQRTDEIISETFNLRKIVLNTKKTEREKKTHLPKSIANSWSALLFESTLRCIFCMCWNRMRAFVPVCGTTKIIASKADAECCTCGFITVANAGSVVNVKCTPKSVSFRHRMRQPI